MTNTIADNLQRLVDATDAIGQAIIDAGGTVNEYDRLEEYPADIATIPSHLGTKSITADGTYIATDDNLDGYSSVTVEVTPPINAIIEPADDTLERALGDGIAPPTPVPPTVPEGTVRFIDYVGSVIHEYPSRVFLGSTSLPSNPTHEGLASQGWNWTLADAKAYVTTYGSLDIGQMYVTSDGKTRLHIRLGDGRLKPYLGLKGDSSGTAVSIDWGDGSESESVTLDTDTVYTPHEYSTSGEYTISITVDTGSIALSGYSTHNSNILRNSSTPNGNDDKVYQNSLIGIEIGNNVSIGAGAFQSCYSLQSITIPDTVTSIGGSAFANCYSLTSITIPDGVTSIGSYTFQTCCSLSSITIPDGVTSISDRAFYNCYSLSSITIPDGVTSISGQVVRNCYSLTSITIPDTVTSIGVSAFQNCFSLQSITIPDGVTSIGSSSTFYGCYSLQSITIPDTVTSIGGSAFANCYSLTSITIPDTVTSIGNQAFMNCNSLTSITIPDSVTSIDAQAFDSCFGLGYIKFEPTTPPAVTSSDAWTALPTDCIIMVPSGTLTAYKTATNYPDPTTYTYVEY